MRRDVLTEELWAPLQHLQFRPATAAVRAACHHISRDVIRSWATTQSKPDSAPADICLTASCHSSLLTCVTVLVSPADVLSAAGDAIEFVVPKEGNIPITDKYSLTAVLTPTPRWPDAMCIIDPTTKVVFTSKFFSAHVAPGLLNSKVRWMPGHVPGSTVW